MCSGWDCVGDAVGAVGDALSGTWNSVTGIPGEVAGQITKSAVGEFAEAIWKGLIKILKESVSWWIGIDSPDLDKYAKDGNTIANLHQWLLPITIAVALGGMIWQGIRMMLMRKPHPLLDIGRGFAMIALWSAIGVTAPNLALKAGDEFSEWVLDQATNGQFQDKLLSLFGDNPAEGGAEAGLLIVLGIIGIIAGAVQAILMIFRNAAIVVLAGVIPLAAAGSFTSATSTWLRKVTAWMAALVFFKPIAALVYAAAFSLIGDAKGVYGILMGLAMMVLSVLALPTAMRLFNWGIGSLETGGGGGFATAGALAGTGLTMAADYHSSGASANDHARFMQQSLGPTNAGGAASSSNDPPHPRTPESGAPPTGGGASAKPDAGGALAANAATSSTAAQGSAAGASSALGPAAMAAASQIGPLTSKAVDKAQSAIGEPPS